MSGRGTGLACWVADESLAGREFCSAASEAMDRWLCDLFEANAEARAGLRAGLAAVGGYGRRELAPQSDVDVVLVHDGKGDPVELAQALWYPIWDAGLKLGHQVLTPRGAQSLAAEDLDTATSLLSARWVGGDAALVTELAERADALWRKRHRRWLLALDGRVTERHERAGEVAFLLEPDIKDGRGGLRDAHSLWWAQRARSVMLPGDDEALAEAYETLLGVRVALHSLTGRPGDRLVLDRQDQVAKLLNTDAEGLMAAVSEAARTIAWRSDETWQRVRSALEGPGRRSRIRERVLDQEIVERDGEVYLTESADPPDAQVALRVAVAAARAGRRIERSTLERVAGAGPPQEPWPPSLRRLLVALLLTGRPAVAVIETLDQVGIWASLLPEWKPVRCLPQRNAYHTFTVDRHLCEAAANAAALAERVDRPDLLVLGALFHDIGKGQPGDHTDAGMEIVASLGPRLGLVAGDVDVLIRMVELHLLLPDVATRRDLEDPGTISFVAEAVRDRQTLDLLAALTEADSLATGPSAWSTWKAELVDVLVQRTRHSLNGGTLSELRATDGQSLDDDLGHLTGSPPHVSGDGDRLTVVARDRSGLFSQVAGVLSLHGLDVLAAEVHAGFGDIGGDMAVERFRVSSGPGRDIDWEPVVADINRAVAGKLAVTARLAERSRRYRSPPAPGVAEPDVRFDNRMSSLATVVEVVASDEVGRLAAITRALAELGLDIRSAKVQTLGPQVVDAFYVVGPDGGKVVDESHLAEVRRALGHVVGLP